MRPTPERSDPPPPQAAGRGLKVMVIINPVSGKGDREAAMHTIVEALVDAGFDYEIRQTGGAGDALRWAREADGVDRIIVAGGDGTVMEALSGVIKNPAPVPLAQLPLGTANLLARALGVPSDLEDALALALHTGVSAPMDVGYLTSHDRYFALVAGSGWDAELIEGADRDLKNKLGFFAYVVSGVKQLFALKRSRVTITIDGREERFVAYEVMVINVGEIEGTGIALGAGVSPHDGKLDLAIAATKTVAGIFRLLFRLLTKRFEGSKDLRYFSAAHFKVEARPPLKLEIDGEPIGETPFEVEVVPDGVRLVVPRHYAEAKKLGFSELTTR